MSDIKSLADIIFDIVPEDVQKANEQIIFGRILTLKDQFISYCEIDGKYPKYSQEESKKKIKEAFKNFSFNKADKFDLHMFDEFLGEYFTKPD